MAITGTGTQADPWVVHSYTELKNACAGASQETGFNKKYVELGNDIDCNDYGENFEWETIQGKSNYAYSLDLKGHTIKNFKVKENQWAFVLSNSYDGSCEIKNGKILNAYLSGAKGFMNRGGGAVSSQLVENLSISINLASGLYEGQSYVFNEIIMNACAIYVEGKLSSGNYSGVFKPYDVNNPISNCDIMVNFPESSGSNQALFVGTNSHDKSVRNCRIRGTFNTPYGIFMCGCHNCVLDLINPTFAYVSQTVQGCTGIVNTDKINTTNISGMTAVTSEEIINGAALRTKGFEVINVVGS